MNAAKLLVASVAFASALAVGSAKGEATYTFEDDGATLVVTVDADTAAMDASQVVDGVTKIVKRGAGKLTAAAISSFTGDFDIEEGIYSGSVRGDFGARSTSASSGTVYVRDGASIECASTSGYLGIMNGKTVHLYGAAASDANGKIYLSANTTMGDPGFGKNMTIVLHDDATFSSAKRFAMFGTFDLGGNVLSLTGSQQFDIGGTVTNGGSVVVKSGTTLMPQSAALIFAADCAASSFVKLESNATLNFKAAGSSANGWTLQNDGGHLTCNTVNWPTDTDIAVWEGPVVLSGSAKIANYGSTTGAYGVSNTVFNVNGAISGDSGSLTVGPGWLNLHGSAENTYSGPVWVQGKSSNQTPNGNTAQPILPGGGGIGVWNGAAVFTNASSITFRDSARLEFMDDTASCVGALRFTGDDEQSIQGGSPVNRPTIAGLTKPDTNTLVISSPARFAGPAAISNGTLRIEKNYQYGNAGLNETHYIATASKYNWVIQQFNKPTAYGGPDSSSSYNAERMTTTDNGTVATGARRCYSADGWTAVEYRCQGYLYTGYVWNRTGADATWQILADNEPRVYVYFGGTVNTELTFVNSESDKALPQEVTLPAGATPISIWICSLTQGSIATPYNYDQLGLMYATNPNVAVADFDTENPDLSAFSQMTDGGTGELFTIDDQAPEAALSAEGRVAGQPVFSSLAFTHGTPLDLAGNPEFFVKDLGGTPTIVNAGTVNVTNNWTILAADFPKADESVRNVMTVDGALVFADGATLSIDVPSAIAKDNEGYVVATATGGITGVPVPDEDSPGELVISGNSLLLRRLLKPMLFIVR